ncbi:MAG TPA: tyrosine-protein phosphatase [Pirellulales bacterium]
MAIAVLAVSGYHLLWRQHVKRFQTVRPGVLYRVAQPSELGMRYLVQHHGVKTVVNLRLEDDHLRRGVLAVGAPTGEVESQFVTELGVRHLQWNMGREACWPWLSPWQYEEFFRLFDEPANLPIAVHCVSGRHRTGTIAALFRLEYDHWPIERVLAEMYSFSFGVPIPLQEMNLRTYVARPQPSARQWQALRSAWAGYFHNELPTDYAEFVRALRTSNDPAAVREELESQLSRESTFALPLTARLIDAPDDAACSASSAAADQCLRRFAGRALENRADNGAEGHVRDDSEEAARVDLTSAASLVADFGTHEQQQHLLDLLGAGKVQPVVTPEFRAIAAGVSNRYTGNRAAFLTVLLDDVRIMPDTGSVAVRFCDMAIAHLSAILDARLINVGSQPTRDDWEQARLRAKAWMSEHPQMARLGALQRPSGRDTLR